MTSYKSAGHTIEEVSCQIAFRSGDIASIEDIPRIRPDALVGG